MVDITNTHSSMAMDHLYFWLAVLAGSAAVYVSSTINHALYLTSPHLTIT